MPATVPGPVLDPASSGSSAESSMMVAALVNFFFFEEVIGGTGSCAFLTRRISMISTMGISEISIHVLPTCSGQTLMGHFLKSFDAPLESQPPSL